MGGETAEVNLSQNPSIILMSGLQGSGKTTFSGKLAKMLKSKKGKRPLLVACDVYRPAAIEQLKVLGEQIDVPVYTEEDSKDPVSISANAVKYAKENHFDLVIVDTAGRLAIDEQMMNEIEAIKKKINPTETLFVVDSMTGQDAVNTAKEFNDRLDFNGVVLTKLDGDTRGGAALSIRSVVNKPIKFVGTGEKLDAIDQFHPARMADRILGMGDIVSLVDRAQEQYDEEEAKRLQKKIAKNQFDFNDFLSQIAQIKKMGNLKDLASMIPGVGKAIKDIDIDDYATFNWKAVADAINILGGIDVEITKSEFYYINAFISETVKAPGVASTQLKSAGMNHLDGVQAVAYGRLRLMDTDYARTERQRKVISLAFEKMKKADWATINNIVQTVFPQVATSIEINDLLKIGRNITRYHLTETTGFPSELREKKMGRKGACVIPQTLESNVIELHHFLFGDEEYTPTETGRTSSQKIVSDTGVHGTKQEETKALPKTTEATTISILDPTQESGADESQEAGSGSDESEKETGNASETQENDVSEQESRPDGTHASKENARESSEAESGGSSPAFPGGNSGTGETENGREKPSGSGSPNGSSAPGSKTDAGIIIE